MQSEKTCRADNKRVINGLPIRWLDICMTCLIYHTPWILVFNGIVFSQLW